MSGGGRLGAQTRSHRATPSPQEPQSCLEASVMFNLFRLLTRDLKCVASGDLCV